MAANYFSEIEPVRYAGPETNDPLAYRYYDAKRVVLGKTMEEHLRISVAYWHTFCSAGADMFGGGMSSALGSSGLAERNLNRFTVVLALIWFVAIVALGLITKFQGI